MILTKRNSYPAETGRGYVDIEEEAANARLALGYDLSSPLPRGVWLLERLTDHPGVLVDGCTYPVTWEAKPTPDHVEADTRFDPEYEEFVIRVDFNAYERMERGAGCSRQRFAICHEVGHVHLHANELVRMSAMPESKVALLRENARRLPIYNDAEWQAEAFGGALLMPAAGLEEMERKGTLGAFAMVRQWGVSDAAARARLRVWAKHDDELKEVAEFVKSENRRATASTVAQ